MTFKIISQEVYLLGIDLDTPFPLSFGILHHLPRVLYKLKASNGNKTLEGYGDASIDFPFSDYDMWDIFHFLQNLDLNGLNVNDKDELLEDLLENGKVREKSGLAAVNMALDDLYGQANRASVGEMYGIKRRSGIILQSVPFHSSVEELNREIKKVLNQRRIPKIKLGHCLDYDVPVISLLEQNFPGVRYAVDFNAGYSLDEAAAFLDQTKARIDGMVVMEQPTSRGEGIKGLIELHKHLKRLGAKTRIVCDETFVNLDDAVECAENGIGLNFKIQKIGGILQAMRIERNLQKLNINIYTMVGGTFPTAIGRVYDQHALSALQYTNLPSDGWQPTTDWFNGEKHAIDQRFIISEEGLAMPLPGHGLGITVRPQFIKSFLIDDPKDEYRMIRTTGKGNRIKIELKNGNSYRAAYESLCQRSVDWNL